jgi:hypothetical protein
MEAPTPHPARAVMVMDRVTIREAAARMEVSPDVLRRWLARRERMPDARRAQLAELLGWPVAELFHDDTEVTA